MTERNRLECGEHNKSGSYDSPLPTQSLFDKGRTLIARDFNKENINSFLSKYRTPVSNKKHESVIKARQKIRKEWQNLKNTTLLSDDSLLGSVLNGTVVYIEIDSPEREIKALKSELKKMGATVKESFTQEVTHIIFNNGSLETYKRAKLLNVHLVSTLWVDACRNSKTKVWENLFPTVNKNDYSNESPGAFRRFLKSYDRNKTHESIGSLANIMKDLRDLDLDIENTDNRIVNNSSGDSSIHLHVTSDSSAQNNSKEASKENRVPDNNYIVPDDSETSYESNEDVSPNKRRLFTKYLKDQSFIRNSSQREVSESSQKLPQYKNPYNSNDKEEQSGKIISPNKSKVNKKKTTPTKKIYKEVVKTVREQTQNKQQYIPQFYTFSKLTQTSSLSQKQKPSLVSTSLHCHENKKLKDVINRLGVFHFKAKVDNRTTHIIAGETRRTMNLLKAVARGCWVLSKKWVEDSSNAGQWLAEEQYEIIEFSKVVQRNRTLRQNFGKNFKLNIFDDIGPIYVNKDCNPPQRDLKELIVLCGGEITNSPRNAKIVIGSIEESEASCVSEKWVLDSIQCGRVKYLLRYDLKK